MKTHSKLFTINLFDWIKTTVMAFVSFFFTTLVSSLAVDHLPTLVEFKKAAAVAFITSVTYLIKQYFTTDQGQLGPHPPAPVPEVNAP